MHTNKEDEAELSFIQRVPEKCGQRKEQKSCKELAVAWLSKNRRLVKSNAVLGIPCLQISVSRNLGGIKITQGTSLSDD